MENFKLQIDEDIKDIQDQFIDLDPKLSSSDYAFNFWILQKLYSVDENLVPNLILEDSDRGIDCYFFDEDRKTLYLMQNKYFEAGTPLLYGTTIDQFLSRSLEHLYQGVYKRSTELQDIFTKYKDDEGFNVFLDFYVTNNSESYENFKQKFDAYSFGKSRFLVKASFFSLDDIELKYFEDRNKHKSNFDISLYTLNKHTRVDINPDIIQDSHLIRSQFMPVNIMDFYYLVKKANKEKYPLFEENIRDFIGEGSQINRGIIETLRCPKERNNFIYYNNGITIIADLIEVDTREGYNENEGRSYIIKTSRTNIRNPQIVNGCQTVNSIYYVLSKYADERKMQEDFKDVYVMVKLLQLSNTSDTDTYLKIVQYNNSQNSIKIKDFVAAQDFFTNLRDDLKRYGFYLLTKQSHANEFKNLDKSTKNSMFSVAEKLCQKVGIEIKTNDLKIDLTKLLQTILAYYDGGHEAYRRKPDVLKKGSSTYNMVTSLIKSITRQQILSVYLYFLKAEKARKQSEDKQTPVPYYLLTFLNSIHGEDLVSYENTKDFVYSYNLAEKSTKMYMTMVLKIEPQYNKLIKKAMYTNEIQTAIDLAKV